MDNNNLSEAIVQEKRNYNILLILILILVIVFSGWYFLSSQKNFVNPTLNESTVESNQPEFVRTVSLDGQVVSIDLAKYELIIEASTIKGGLMNNENIEAKVKERIIKINQGTVIQKLIVSKDVDGLTNRSGSIEMNLSDLKKGDKVSVIYNGLEEDRDLNNVQNISVVFVADNFDETYQGEYDLLNTNSSAISFSKGKVLSVNGTNIEYALYAFNKLGTDKYLAVVQPSTKIYAISDPSRISINHAKREISIEKIKAGDDIFIASNDNSSLNASGEVKEVVVVSNE